MEIHELANTELKITIIKMLYELRRKRMNKVKVSTRIGQKRNTEILDLQNITSELKNSIEGFNSTLDQAESQ